MFEKNQRNTLIHGNQNHQECADILLKSVADKTPVGNIEGLRET